MIWWILGSVIFIIIVFFIAERTISPYGPNPYFDRGSNRPLWEERFDGSELTITEHVLECFCDAFLQEKEKMFNLRPDDKIIDIYQVHYPEGSNIPDELELNRFALDVEQEFGFKFKEEYLDKGEATLSKIIELVIKKHQKMPS